MIVSDFCLKKHHFPKLIAICSGVFICVVIMAAVFYNQTSLFCNRDQTSSLSFTFIHLDGASEQNVIPRRNGKALSYRNLIV